jgi:DNA-binding IscR family transcriptional regulator
MIATDAAPSRALAFRPGFLWEQLVARIAASLDQVSIADLCRDAGEARTQRAEREGPMYFI